jgi:16S rRNA C967 or C1407 C5-methylase (RsmB/RsmF family)/NOL1/NOP2/fmu family ribosome biogenesis protein
LELPQALLDSLEGIKGYNREAFINVHNSGEQVTSIRLNPLRSTHSPLATHHLPIPWTSHGYYLPTRPSFTFDPAFHGGLYYVQEASSMFLEQALKQTTDLTKNIRVLDLCAAPGGKSTLIQSLITPDSLLVSNDVIKTRAAILEENLTKWGALNTIVSNNDPSVLGKLENFFDVLVIDAPCSGSGLFRRDEEAMDEWSEQNVQLCTQRQQRILSDSYACLREEGVLVYSTCSYSQEEDEEILDWLLQTFELESLPLQTDPAWGIVEVTSEVSKAYGYRFFPDQVKGEGLFLACFRKKEGGHGQLRTPRKSKWTKLSKTETAIVQPWLKPEASVQLWKQGDMIVAFPVSLEVELLTLADQLYLRKAGIIVGKIAGNTLVPDHALALSDLLSDKTVAVTLKKEEALQYLRREEVKIPAAQTGWTLVKYEGISLGWVKILPNRVNNYYPSAWRILKSGNN